MRVGATKNNGCKTCREDVPRSALSGAQTPAARSHPRAAGGRWRWRHSNGRRYSSSHQSRQGGGGNWAYDASMSAVHRWQTGKYKHSRAAPPLTRLAAPSQPEAPASEPAPLSRAGHGVESRPRGYPPPRRPPSSHLHRSQSPYASANINTTNRRALNVRRQGDHPRRQRDSGGRSDPEVAQGDSAHGQGGSGPVSPAQNPAAAGAAPVQLGVSVSREVIFKALLMSCRKTLCRCRWWGADDRPTSTSLSAPALPAPSTATPCCRRTPAHRQDRAGLWPPTVRCHPQPSQAPRRLHGAAGQRLTADKRRPAADRSHRVTGPWSLSAGRWRLRRQRACTAAGGGAPTTGRPARR